MAIVGSIKSAASTYRGCGCIWYRTIILHSAGAGSKTKDTWLKSVFWYWTLSQMLGKMRYPLDARFISSEKDPLELGLIVFSVVTEVWVNGILVWDYSVDLSSRLRHNGCFRSSKSFSQIWVVSTLDPPISCDFDSRSYSVTGWWVPSYLCSMVCCSDNRFCSFDPILDQILEIPLTMDRLSNALELIASGCINPFLSLFWCS